MQKYSYVAKNSHGNLVKGIFEAESTQATYSMLKAKGLFPIDISIKKEAGFSLDVKIEKKVKTKDLAIFARQFCTVLRAGVPVVKSLDILRRQTESRMLTQALDEIYQDIQKGVLLSEAMRKYKNIFSTVFTNMIEAGELSGTLDKSLEKMAIQLEKEYKLQQKISGALTYPLIMMIITCLAVGVLLGFVVPQFKEIFDSFGISLPFTTRMLLVVGVGLKKFWYLVLAGMVGIFFGIQAYKKSPSGKVQIDKMALKLPVVSAITKKVLAARFTRLTATMLNSGVSLIKTLEVAERIVENGVARQGLRDVIEKVTKGTDLATPVHEMGLFPMMVPQMIKVGEESGSLDAMLDKTADFCEDEVDTAISQLTTLLEPAIMVFMSIVVGFIVISIIVPMFQISASIK